MKQRINYHFVKIFMKLEGMLPRNMLYGLNSWLMMQFYHKKIKQRAITQNNLKKVFPTKTDQEVEEMSKNVYMELSKTISEIILINAGRFDVDGSIVNADEALEKLNNISSSSDNGVIYIMAHYANWELLGHWMARNGHTLTGVVKDGKNRYIDEKILLPFRNMYGNRSVPHRGSMIALAKALKNGKSVSLAIDQVVKPPNGIAVDFFGHQTAGTKAIAMLKQKYNPTIVPIFITRVGYEKFKVSVGSSLENVESIEEMTQEYYDAIERHIRLVPEQWLWIYNRWKRVDFGEK